jgi:hypothetical protein
MVFNANGKTVILNGGDPIKDCPTDWKDAEKWAEDANKDTPYRCPKWRWDCGYKLDYDGGMVTVSSRFYPPKTHSGDKWVGTCDIDLLGVTMLDKKLECETLEELRSAVETFVKGLGEKLKQVLETGV